MPRSGISGADGATRSESILVVDDDPGSSSYMALALEQVGYHTRVADSGPDALRAIEREQPALVVSDLEMPGMSGLALLATIKQRWPTLPVLLVTVRGEVSTIVEAVQLGAVNYLMKPVSHGVLQAAAAKALARAARAESSEPRSQEIVGTSAAILQVRHVLALASRSDVNVFVVGDTGTGKELVARAVHRLSDCTNGPFVAYNCALTAPDLFDGEFFGHLRGAFTGAHRDRLGLLREADGGVLFLDELECLTLAHQAKLLRVLDDGEVRPVGSEKAVSVAVRFVAATNRAPELMIQQGELREDLYYRLRGFEIRLPPLRDRLEDIPLLCEHFLRPRGKSLSHEAVAVLQRCSWPGNIRQLRAVLDCAAALAPADSIEAKHLDLTIPGATGPPPYRPPSTPQRASLTLEQLERDAIAGAISAHGGNLSRAAKALGIHRSTLHRRARELGLLPSR